MNIKATMVLTTIDNYLQLGDLAELLSSSKMALKEARENQDKEPEVAALIGLALSHLYLGKFYDARVYADGALQFAQSLGLPELIIAALNTSGLVFFVGGFKIDEAETDYRAALQLAHQQDDKRGIATALAGLAVIFNHTHDYNRGVTYAREAFDFARDVDNYTLMATTLGIMGNSFVRLGSYEKALKAFDDALEICDKHNVKFLDGYLIGNKGLLLAQDTRYFDEAVNLLEGALARVQKMNNAPHEFALLHINALAREFVGQDKIALDYYMTMLARAQTWKNQAYECMTFYEIGRVQVRMLDYKEAIANFEQAASLSRQTMNPFYEAQIEAALGMTHRLNRDFEQALTHYMTARSLYDALDDDSKTREMTQAIVLTYLNRFLDKILRFLGIRSKESHAVDETAENDDSSSGA